MKNQLIKKMKMKLKEDQNKHENTIILIIYCDKA